MKAENSIDPYDPQYCDISLWCVYGYDCFPEIIACKLHNHGEYGINIWGYSVYKRKPGYRTLGRQVGEWMEQHKMVKFFDNKEDALAFIGKLVTPKCTVNGDKL